MTTGAFLGLLDMHKNAKAYISIDGYKGEEFEVQTGVRQGDVLAPLLFLLVINPLLEKIEKAGLGYSL